MGELLKDLDQSRLWVCAIDGCKAEPVREIIYYKAFDKMLRLSSCKDPEHQNIITFFLKEKGDIGTACIELQERGMKLDDGPCKVDSEHRLMTSLIKYLKALQKGD